MRKRIEKLKRSSSDKAQYLIGILVKFILVEYERDANESSISVIFFV